MEQTQSREIDSVIAKIRKLCVRTREAGCTEAEAISAAQKVGELLSIYNLTLDRVFLQENRCVHKQVVLERKNRHSSIGTLVSIGRFCGVKVWTSHSKKYTVNFFGMESDVEMALYLYDMIYTAIDTETASFKETKEYKETHYRRKTLTVSFMNAMASTISLKLNRMANANVKDEILVEDENNTTSIILLKAKKIEDEFKTQLGYRLVNKKNHQRISHTGAASLGRKAGNSINFNRPMEGSSKVKGYLQ